MLAVNHLNGFDAVETVSEPTLIPGATGSNIGNMTSSGGLAAGFDDTTSQARAACAQGTTGSTAGNTIGKDWTSTKTITKFVLYGPNDNGVMNGGTMTIKLQGSTDNFSGSIVDLYTSGGIAGTTGSNYILTVPSGITTTTAYRYHRIITTNAGGDDGYWAEVDFYEG